MTTLAQLRKAALGMPEAQEDDKTFSVHGTVFASVTDGVVELRLPQPARMPLAGVDGQKLNLLVREAWYHCAPKELADELARADAGVKPPGSDLPDSIGRTAVRALLGERVGTLALVAERSEAELLAIHGVGPKAVRILVASLNEKGLSLRE